MDETNKKLNTDPYKGVRDFYPEDMFIQNYIFRVMREASESFGYAEYEASVLEPAELYRAKSGEEIVNDQTYIFKDRGDREVALRPEMTPTAARMVAGKKRELVFPLRWYSIPNLFRYEQPQRGRAREHWQLNADIFGVKEIQAEIEIMALAYSIMRRFGLKDENFEIRINSRKVMDYLLEKIFALSPEAAKRVSKLIDRKKKMPAEEFEKGIKENLGEQSQKFIAILNAGNFEEFASLLPAEPELTDALDEIKKVIAGLNNLGVENAVFDQTIMRGFDYYTSIVFEVFDKNPKNPRSVFGGGRYDDLLSLFGGEKTPAVGVGMGDIVIRDILETYGLLPKYAPPAEIYICIADTPTADYANKLAKTLRDAGIKVAVDYSFKKLGDQMKTANKQKIPFAVCVGTDEAASGDLKIKEMETGAETILRSEKAADFIRLKMEDKK